VKGDTYRKVKDYRMAGASFDDVLSELMRSVPVEAFAERVIDEHYQRMREREGRPWRRVLRRPRA